MGIYKFGNNTYPQRIRRKSNLCHFFRGKKCVLWARKYGMFIGGIMTLSYWGVCRSFALVVAHGLCSSGLFCLSNISYERCCRWSLLINKGLINLMPRMAIWWFLLRDCNMAAPPPLNLLGETFFFCEVLGIKWNALISLRVIHCLAHCFIWS
jgi:NADH:ubiquinone oxidoreductase subunit 4 (subunit M)